MSRAGAWTRAIALSLLPVDWLEKEPHGDP